MGSGNWKICQVNFTFNFSFHLSVLISVCHKDTQLVHLNRQIEHSTSSNSTQSYLIGSPILYWEMKVTGTKLAVWNINQLAGYDWFDCSFADLLNIFHNYYTPGAAGFRDQARSETKRQGGNCEPTTDYIKCPQYYLSLSLSRWLGFWRVVCKRTANWGMKSNGNGVGLCSTCACRWAAKSFCPETGRTWGERYLRVATCGFSLRTAPTFERLDNREHCLRDVRKSCTLYCRSPGQIGRELEWPLWGNDRQ